MRAFAFALNVFQTSQHSQRQRGRFGWPALATALTRGWPCVAMLLGIAAAAVAGPTPPVAAPALSPPGGSFPVAPQAPPGQAYWSALSSGNTSAPGARYESVATAPGQSPAANPYASASNYLSSNYATPGAIQPQALPEPTPSPEAGFGEDEGVVSRVFERPVFGDTEGQPVASDGPYFDGYGEEPWTGQVLPNGLIYRSYLAGRREPRFSFATLNQTNYGSVWEAELGARVGIFRYGTTDPFFPQGWEIDVEGASFSRLDPVVGPQDLIANDYRFGLPLTYGRGNWQFKLAYWHLSSHVGDEFLIRNPTFERINYVRNAFVLGASWTPVLNLRLYAEVGWAFHVNGGAKPWETQFGIEYRPGYPTGWRGAPFAAVNAHLLEDNNFGGNFVTQAGWAWRGPGSGQMFRLGFEYVNGTATQYAFEGQWEQQAGFGIWYDF